MTLVLVGAGGLAREVLPVARKAYREVVAVDDDPSTWGSSLYGVRVLGGLDLVSGLPDAEVLVCLGRGTARRAVVERLAQLGVGQDRYPTVIHPSVEIPAGCSVEGGSIVLAQVAMTADVRVGRHVVVMPNATLTHDDVLENFATVCAGVALGGAVRIGEAAYIGMNASVREGLEVGYDSTLGMGAVLVESMPPGQTWAGVPAVRVGNDLARPDVSHVRSAES
jgi:sugar O-acyltransferase (sialic acid O-acetyltransferase NeuD family)